MLTGEFDPKKCYKQVTMNFNGQQDEMDNDDLMDEEDMAFTPSAATEASLRHMPSSSAVKNEYDIDMDDDEETKEEPTIAGVSVPIENLRQASKSLGVEMLEQPRQHVTMPD